MGESTWLLAVLAAVGHAPAVVGVSASLEAAQASLLDGFDRAGLGQIVAYTAQANLPSIAVMKRLGMTLDEDGGFLHPELPEDHVLRPHVLYRLNREDYVFKS